MKLEVRFFELIKNSVKATEIYNTWLFIKKDFTNQLDMRWFNKVQICGLN